MVKSYLPNSVPIVDEAEWMSQYDAAEALGINIVRVGWLVANDHLDAVETTGQVWPDSGRPVPGVTREGVERELRWRQETARWRKLRRVVADLMDYVF